jgi:hypothetical protein
MILHQKGRKRRNIVLLDEQISFDRRPSSEDQRMSLESPLTDLALHVPDSDMLAATDGDVAAGCSQSRRFIPLHSAIQCGASLPIILAVLRERAQDMNTLDDDGRTPLHWAVCHARIRKEAASNNPAASTGSSQSPKKKKKKKSKSSKAQVSESNDLDANAMQLDLVRMCVTPESARLRDGSGRLPLHLALQNQAPCPVVACLLEAHPKSGVLPCHHNDGHASGVTAPQMHPVHLACHYDCELSVVYQLLRADPDVLPGNPASC